MSEDWYTVIVKIQGKAKNYEAAGHGVKHRIIDSLKSIGFKESNVKILSIKKMRGEEINRSIPIDNNAQYFDSDINEMVDFLFDQSESNDIEDIIDLGN